MIYDSVNSVSIHVILSSPEVEQLTRVLNLLLANELEFISTVPKSA